MSAITALINMAGRVILVLLEAQIRMVFALGKALGATITALWQARTGGTPKRRHRTRPSRRPRRRYASKRR